MTLTTRSKSAEKAKKVAKKVIAKDKEPKVTAKKQKLTDKKVAHTSKKSDVLEVCLMLDCTGSMMSWIQRSKDQLAGIIQNIRKTYDDLKVRVCFVGYRDFGDRNQFEVCPFTEDLDAVTKFIAK